MISDDDGIRIELERLWALHSHKINWLSFEQALVDMLKADLHEADRLRAIKELIDATTRRGHFDPSEYYQRS